MPRALDRVLTGFALFVAGGVLTGLAYAALKEVAIEVGAWSSSPRGPARWVQGHYIQFPRQDARVRIPVVLQDGTLEPAREYGWIGWGTIHEERREENPPAVFLEWREGIRRAELASRLREDYRQTRFHTRRTSPPWVISPGRGILAIDDRGRLIGSLTDGGFIPGRRVPSSFDRSRQWYPNPLYPIFVEDGLSFLQDGFSFVEYGFLPSGQERNPNTLYYLTDDGFYRADLKAPAIVRHLSLDGSRALLWVSPLHRRVYVVLESRVHWFSMDDPSKSGLFEVPPSVRGDALELGEGSAGKILFRSRAHDRYQVVVCAPSGSVEREYSYTFAAQGAQVRKGVWGHAPDPALDKFASVVAPPAWRLALRLPPDLLEAFHFRPHQKDFGFGPMWVSVVVCALISALVGMRARPHYRTWAGPVAWGAFILAFGLPAWAVFLFSGARQRTEMCRKCGHFRSVAFAACPRCGDPAPSPPALGIEILRPA